MTSEPTKNAAPIRLSCRCLATREPEGWRIDAEAFLCGHKHKQGDLVSHAAEARNATIEADFERAEDDYFERTVDLG